MSYGVERIENGMAGVDQLKSILIDFFSHSIKRYILGQTLTSEADSSGGGNDLAAIHLNTFMQIVRYDCTNLQETIDRELLQPLIEFNFPEMKGTPLHFKIDTEAADVESKLQAWQTAWQMGVKLKANDVYNMIGAVMPRQNDDVLLNPQIQQAELQIEQMRQQMQMMQQQAAMGQPPGQPAGAGRPGRSPAVVGGGEEAQPQPAAEEGGGKLPWLANAT